jgi:hypothetical protein
LLAIGLDHSLSAPAVACGAGVLVRQSGPVATSFLDDLLDPPMRGVQADVGIGGSIQDVDRCGLVDVPRNPAQCAVKPIPVTNTESARAGMTCKA